MASKKNLSWKEFCALVLATDDLSELESMLRTLKRRTPLSLNRLLRVHSRLNKLRADEERKKLVALSIARSTEDLGAASAANGDEV